MTPGIHTQGYRLIHMAIRMTPGIHNGTVDTHGSRLIHMAIHRYNTLR